MIVHNSAILRQVLQELLMEEGARFFYSGADARPAVEHSLRHQTDLLIIGEGLSGLSECDLATEASHWGNTSILFLGNPGEANTARLQSAGVALIPRPELSLINDPSYRIKLKTSFLAAVKQHKAIEQGPRPSSTVQPKLLVIGSSTGGPNALKVLLKGLGDHFPLPVAIVQHLEAGHEQNLAEWLASETGQKVRLALDGDLPKPGEFLLASQGKHLILRDHKFALVQGPKVCFQIPSVDRLFETAAQEWGAALLGVLLTGMGSDGAEGCKMICKQGGYTITEAESTCVVYGMPKAAVALGGSSCSLPLPAIADAISRRVRGELT